MAEQTVRVQRINVLGAAIVAAVASAIAGLAIGVVLYLVAQTAGAQLAEIPVIGSSIGEIVTSLGVTGLIASPIVLAVLGFVAGAVAALVANALLPRMGILLLEEDRGAALPPAGREPTSKRDL